MKKRNNFDVQWAVPDKKRPIAYSTVAVSNNIKLISDFVDIKTPKNILDYIINEKLVGCYDEIKILQTYIDKGYKDLILKFC